MSFSDPKHNIEQCNLDPGMTVADLGSGSGHYTLAVAHIVGGQGKVYSIDIQKDLLKRTHTNAEKEHLHNVEILHGDLEKIGGTRLKDSSIDFAFATNILFQLTDKTTFLKEVKRILKPSGRLLLVDWADSYGGIGPIAPHVISEAKAKEMVEKEGLTFERKINAGAHHYGMIFKNITNHL